MRGRVRRWTAPDPAASALAQAVHDVVRPHALAHLDAYLFADPGRVDRSVIALEPLDALVEVGGVPAHVDRIAHAQPARVERYDARSGVLVVVGDDADSMWLRIGDVAGR